jgi:hypothetical protein
MVPPWERTAASASSKKAVNRACTSSASRSALIFGVARKVGEEHAHLSALARDRFGRGWRRPIGVCFLRLIGRATQRRDGIEQALAVAEGRDADVLQIVGRQTPEHVPVDVVFTKQRGVAVETETLQPIHDVHGSSPARERNTAE